MIFQLLVIVLLGFVLRHHSNYIHFHHIQIIFFRLVSYLNQLSFTSDLLNLFHQDYFLPQMKLTCWLATQLISKLLKILIKRGLDLSQHRQLHPNKLLQLLVLLILVLLAALQFLIKFNAFFLLIYQLMKMLIKFLKIFLVIQFKNLIYFRYLDVNRFNFQLKELALEKTLILNDHMRSFEYLQKGKRKLTIYNNFS